MNIPIHLQKIILFYLEDLDTRRELGELPRKLKNNLKLKLFFCRTFYFTKSQKLMQIDPGCCTSIFHPVELYDEKILNKTVFNIDWDEYTYEWYTVQGHVIVDPTQCVPIFMRGPILFIDK